MVQTVAEVRARVERQKQLVPAMYGGIDFGLRAERFADAGGENSGSAKSMLPVVPQLRPRRTRWQRRYRALEKRVSATAKRLWRLFLRPKAAARPPA